MLVRALGPSLTPFGVAGALNDPMLDLHDGAGNHIATNDNWKDSQEQAIVDTGLAPANDSESAIVATLTRGNYTAIMSGKGIQPALVWSRSTSWIRRPDFSTLAPADLLAEARM